jgi:tetratricopeptide (TPR) repeat protein
MLEERLFADAADGRWDEHSLLAAALVASGVEDQQHLDGYLARVAAAADELRRSGEVAGPPQRQAQAVLEFLHRNILQGGYQIDCTDLRIPLDDGRFNCVSASVLFNCFAEQFGLEAQGLEVPGHAMSRLVLPDGVLDVETTCPTWFRLLNDPKKQAALVQKTLGTTAAGLSTPAERRVVSAVELVATIYYNRGVDLLGQRRFAQAVAANAKALRLDPFSSTAQGNLLASLNNWAIDLGGSGRHAEAVEILDQGLALDSSYATFKTNYLHVHHQWTEELCRKQRFDEAAGVLAAAAWKQLDKAWFRQATIDVYHRWARSDLQSGRIDDAFRTFALARQQLGAAPDVLEREIAEVNQRASTLLFEQRFSEALSLLDRALAVHPASATLAENRGSAVMHWARPAFERRDYREAIRRTTHGATPGQLDDPLLNNVRYAYYQWISELLAGGHRDEARRIAQQALADPFLKGQSAGALPQFPVDAVSNTSRP